MNGSISTQILNKAFDAHDTKNFVCTQRWLRSIGSLQSPILLQIVRDRLKLQISDFLLLSLYVHSVVCYNIPATETKINKQITIPNAIGIQPMGDD